MVKGVSFFFPERFDTKSWDFHGESSIDLQEDRFGISVDVSGRKKNLRGGVGFSDIFFDGLGDCFQITGTSGDVFFFFLMLDSWYKDPKKNMQMGVFLGYFHQI